MINNSKKNSFYPLDTYLSDAILFNQVRQCYVFFDSQLIDRYCSNNSNRFY